MCNRVRLIPAVEDDATNEMVIKRLEELEEKRGIKFFVTKGYDDLDAFIALPSISYDGAIADGLEGVMRFIDIQMKEVEPSPTC